MADERFVINVILKARDEMSAVITRATNEMSKIDKITAQVNQNMGKFDNSINNMKKSLNQLTDAAEKTRRGIRSIGGEDIKVKMELDDSNFQRNQERIRKSLETTITTVEKLKQRKEELFEERAVSHPGRLGFDKISKEIDEVSKQLVTAEGNAKSFGTQLRNLEKDNVGIQRSREELRKLDADLEKVTNRLQRGGTGEAQSIMVVETRRIKKAMADLGMEWDEVNRRADFFTERAKAFGGTSATSFDHTTRAVRRASTAIRRAGKDLDDTGSSLRRFHNRLEQNRLSVARFDNELRGFAVFFFIAQLQALSSVVTGLVGALGALGGSAITAGAALGGAMTAAAAQAIPALGLIAAAVSRLKAVFDVVDQIQKEKQASATQATSADDKQAAAADQLANAQGSLRDAHQRVTESQKNLNEARKEARRDLEDLILAEKESQLNQEQAEDRVRQLRSSGTTGFELQAAQLNLEQSAIDQRRSAEDLAQERVSPTKVNEAKRSLRDAQEGLESARRGLAGAQRGIESGAASSVAAGRILQFLEADLTQSERRLVKSITRLKDTWREVSRPITDIIVQSFTRAVDRVEKVIQNPRLIGAFTKLSRTAGRQMDRIVNVFTDKRGQAFMERTTRDLTKNLEPAGTAAVRLSRAFMNIADAAAPTLHLMVQDIAKLAKGIEDITKNDAGMRELFAFGRKQLLGWFELAKSVGGVIKALIAPGGDLQSGAAASGLRILNGLTERFKNAAEWINEHPLDVKKFFGESEKTLNIIIDLLIKIGEHMLKIFDPEAVQALSDIIEALLPTLQTAAEVMGAITKVVAAFVNTDVGQFITHWVLLAAILSKMGKTIGGMGTAIAHLATGTVLNTGRIVGGFAAATTAVGRYIAALKLAAGIAGPGAIVAGGVGRGGKPIIAPGPFPPGTKVGPQAPTTGGAGATARNIGVGSAIGAAATGAARILGPIAAFVAAVDLLTRQGSPVQRIRGTLSAGTFGGSERLIDKFGSRTRGQIGGPGGSSVIDQLAAFGGEDKPNPILERIRKGMRQALRDEDITRFRELNKELNKLASQDWGEETNKQADKLKKGVRGALTELEKLKHGGPRPQDILNQETVNKVLDNMARMRGGVFSNVQALRRSMNEQFARITDGTAKDSATWKTLMIENFGSGIKGLRASMRLGLIDTKAGMEEINKITKRQMTFARDNMKNLSEDAKEKLAANFKAARVAVTRQAGGIENATAATLRRIRRLMAIELELFGFTPKQAANEVKPGTRFDGGPEEGSRGAVGGFVGRRGERGRDSGLFRLGRGEAVLNWAHQKVVEPAMQAYYGHGLPDMFRHVRGAHAGSGLGGLGLARGKSGSEIVSVPGFPGEQAARSILDEIAFYTKRYGLTLTDAYGSGHKSPGHTTYGTAADLAGPDKAMDQAVKALVQKGYVVGYDGRFGSQNWPGHGPTAAAGSNAHIHVEFGSTTGTAPSADIDLRKIRRKMNEAIKNNLGDYPAGGELGEIGRAVAKSSRQIAMRTLRAVSRKADGPIGAEYSGGVGPAGTATRAQMVKWATTALHKTGHGASMTAINKILALAMKESSWQPRSINLWDSNAKAGNPSGGLMHVTIDKVGGKWPQDKNKLWDPVRNMIASINYQFSRYGGLITHSPYAMGGMIPGPEGFPTPILAHAGEWILNKSQQVKAAGMAGLSAGGLRDRLGFTGGPSSYQGGGLVVGDSIAAGMEKFLKKMGFRVDAQKNRTADETLDVLKNLIKDRTKRVVFDAGTNDSDPQMLRKVLNNLMRVVGDRQLLLTTAGGQNAAAKNAVIRDFAKRDNVDLFNSQAFARSKGFDLDQAGHYPGPQAYRARARAIAGKLGRGGDVGFELPDILPDTLKTTNALIKDFFKHIKKFKSKSEDNWKAINTNLHILTREGGLLDTMRTAWERQLGVMQTRILRRGFQIRGGKVKDVRGEVGDARAEARELNFVNRSLRTEDRAIGRGLRTVRRTLRQIRRGGIDEDEREEFNDLIGQRRNLRDRRAVTRGAIAENIQARFENQARRIQASLDKSLRPILRRVAENDIAQRIAAAFGRGGEIGFIDTQIALLKEQQPFIRAALAKAQAQGNTELAETLQNQLDEISVTIEELVAQRLQQQVADLDKRFSRARRVNDLRDRFAAATGTLSLDRIIPGFGGTRRQAFEGRQSIIQQEIAERSALAYQAALEGNTSVLEQLTEQIEDLQVELAENSRALFLSRIEEVNRKFGTVSGQATARSRIAELQAELGIITGTQSQERQRSELGLIGSGLRAQAVSLGQLLAEARARQDEEQIASLEQALLDNTVAQLENSLAIKNLDGSLNDTQSFSSTAWQWFRTAIFTGSGGLLPQFNYGATMGTSGALPSPTIGGGIAPMGSMGSPTVNLEINEAGQVPDPVYLGNRIAWAARTPGT